MAQCHHLLLLWQWRISCPSKPWSSKIYSAVWAFVHFHPACSIRWGILFKICVNIAKVDPCHGCDADLLSSGALRSSAAFSPYPYLLFCPTSPLHVLIHEWFLKSSAFPLTWRLYIQHPLSLYWLSYIHVKTTIKILDLSSLSEILISNHVYLGCYQWSS